MPIVAPMGRTCPEDIWPRVYGDHIPVLRFLPVLTPLQPLHSHDSASSAMAEHCWWVPQEPQELQSSILQGLNSDRSPRYTVKGGPRAVGC